MESTINNMSNTNSAWDKGPPNNILHKEKPYNSRFIAGTTIYNNDQECAVSTTSSAESNAKNDHKNIERIPEKKHHQQYYSAGVLLYSRDPKGTLVFLLGKDKDGTWSDFGGRSEFTDHGNHTKTAARELYEETMGSVMTMECAQKMLSMSHFENKRAVIRSRTLGGSPYIMFVLGIQFADYKQNFKRVHDYVKYIGQGYIEKVDIRWVSEETLMGAIDEDLDNESVLLPLRPIFKTTLVDHISEMKDIKNLK